MSRWNHKLFFRIKWGFLASVFSCFFEKHKIIGITLLFEDVFSEFRYIFLIIVMYFVILLCRGKLMLYRKAYDYMLNWKSSKDKKALLITGARQTGKTYIVREFCKTKRIIKILLRSISSQIPRQQKFSAGI